MNTTPLISAVQSGDISEIKSLLKTGININQTYNGLTALQYAIKTIRIKVIKLLIEEGANLGIYNSINKSSLEHIFERFKQRSALPILKIMPNVHIVDDYDKCTALHFAAKYNYCECIEYLLQRGIDVKGMNSRGQTPMIFAAISGSHESIELLVNHGGDVDRPDKVDNQLWSPIFYAISNSHVRCVDSLIKRRADLNAIDCNGLTPIFYALHNLEFVKLLVENGADINFPDKSGRTPIFHAVFKHDAPLIELLINLGANVDHVDIKGWTPLFYAIAEGDDQVIQLLLNNCLNAGYVNTKSYSALDLAKQIREPGMRDLISCCIERKIMSQGIIASQEEAGAMLSF
jgi:ankyrin repeat protein